MPDAFADPPFDSDRNLVVPPGFRIRLWARVDRARFMALAPNGDVLVSVPSAGKIVLLCERASDVPQAFDYAGNAGAEMDLVSGFVIDADRREVWRRPVDAIADAKGNLLMSDDYAGAIYQLYPIR